MKRANESRPMGAASKIPPLKSVSKNTPSTGFETMTTLARYLEKFPNSKETLILKLILANYTPDQRAAKRSAAREAKFSDDVIQYLESQDRRRYAENRTSNGGDFI